MTSSANANGRELTGDNVWMPPARPKIVKISALLDDLNARGGPGTEFTPIPASQMLPLRVSVLQPGPVRRRDAADHSAANCLGRAVSRWVGAARRFVIARPSPARSAIPRRRPRSARWRLGPG